MTDCATQCIAQTRLCKLCAATVQAWCAERGIEHAAAHSGTVKKWATGRGNAPKREMCQRGRENFGCPDGTEDELDALWILSWAQERSASLLLATARGFLVQAGATEGPPVIRQPAARAGRSGARTVREHLTIEREKTAPQRGPRRSRVKRFLSLQAVSCIANRPSI